MKKYILALDQGTTSSRAILFGHDGRPVSVSQKEFPQILPEPGHVEHDPEDIWSSQLEVARDAIRQGNIESNQIAAIGVTNQRETTILWEKATGKPVANAIVWQSRISAKICEQLKADGHETLFRERTGLLLDPYFSGTKVKYLLDADPELRDRARKGEILFGTVDSFLIWRLSGQACHVTDPSNASRTLLFDIHRMEWDDELLDRLDIPRAMLPDVKPSSAVYCETDESCLGCRIPIAGAAGDQQAATFGQACFEPGSAKNTYGTGCFLLLNTGEQAVASQNNLLTTVGWSFDGKTTYCLEGSVFVAGAAVQWLRDGLGVIESSADVERLAATVEDNGGVYFVPALVGLGAPHWDSYARGSILGISRGTTAGHLARATVESMAFQSRDLLVAMSKDAGTKLHELKVDGGACVNNALMQFQADILGISVRRPMVPETTALGAAYLAGLAVGYWEDQADIVRNWVLEREFTPSMDEGVKSKLCRSWTTAVERSKAWPQ